MDFIRLSVILTMLFILISLPQTCKFIAYFLPNYKILTSTDCPTLLCVLCQALLFMVGCIVLLQYKMEIKENEKRIIINKII